MEKPIIHECLLSDGSHDKWILIDPSTDKEIWSEKPNTEELILIEDTQFVKSGIYDIYDIERDKKNFWNTEAGFIVQTINRPGCVGKKYRFGERIPYESYPHEIARANNKWRSRMEEAIKLWKK